MKTEKSFRDIKKTILMVLPTRLLVTHRIDLANDQ